MVSLMSEWRYDEIGIIFQACPFLRPAPTRYMGDHSLTTPLLGFHFSCSLTSSSFLRYAAMAETDSTRLYIGASRFLPSTFAFLELLRLLSRPRTRCSRSVGNSYVYVEGLHTVGPKHPETNTQSVAHSVCIIQYYSTTYTLCSSPRVGVTAVSFTLAHLVLFFFVICRYHDRSAMILPLQRYH